MLDLHTHARPLAACIVELLGPACDRIAVAGSVRRESPEVKDIEIVAIAKTFEVKLPVETLFGTEHKTEIHSVLDLHLKDVLGPAGHILDWKFKWEGESLISQVPEANGPRFKKLYATLWQTGVDLFIATPETWGNIFAIRTGHRHFSEAAMWQIRNRGLSHKEGRLLDGETFIPCPEEEDFFRVIGWPCLPPKERTLEAAQRLIPHFTPGEMRNAS